MSSAERERTYIAIDLKSFYASVECHERGLDPLTTNLVVADTSRTEKTICLAVSPSLKSYGIGGRARLFEVVQRVREVNAQRRAANHGRPLRDPSYDNRLVQTDPTIALGYITAVPQMSHYMDVSASIYDLYLRRIAPEDIHVYSIDEVFMDVTAYLRTYCTTAHELARSLIQDVLDATGITATAGIGTNLYLCKVAMDVVAKHMPADADGVRIAELDEATYRRQLWTHEPLTDFWRVGPGYAAKLAANGMHTMGDVARQSLVDEDVLYDLFGVNAEYLIDHAWGVETTTMADIHAYKPRSNSVSTGQVLPRPYDADACRVVVREMAVELSLDLVAKGLVTDSVGLMIGYDRASLDDPDAMAAHDVDVAMDWYGRAVPKHAQGGANIGRYTASTRLICDAVLAIYDRVVNPSLLCRRITISANVVEEAVAQATPRVEQLDLFTDYEEQARRREQLDDELRRERSAQEQILQIKQRFGKNAILRGTDFVEGARTIERNGQIGGHRA